LARRLDALRRLGQRAQRVLAFFALLYYAGMRPSEAANVREADFTLPEAGWGRVILWETAPAVGSQWTDDGQIHDRRGLKHRPAKATRPVPIPPVLVTLIRWHIETFGTTPDGRLFRGIHGGQLSSSIYTRWWRLARVLAFTEAQVSSPLARRPYDLRHAAASLWLNSGVPATEVARRLGHSVKVLLAIYANCIDGGDDGLNDRIDGALNPTPRTGPHGNIAGTPSAEAARAAKQRLVTGKMRSKIAHAL
jgi:integrase